ncbi:type III-B CRISPR module RAMP protein Cmr4 [Anoxybacillus sp. UARK-01]|uniref:type III-B CRISPR module RAMP protein Cmr4 n=1 Tax=Anoxybacillus sp. UARK-01 TaxID=1895648 RepID=UPI0009B9A20A|nr:type III-B CRISPR module RAMP protein Cmr4 [Anoxybacillus sp. UARK-01]OQM46683.1 type III-B CRISPR module RAMP protein Cmr4 [Anoxybacillus sp. UARK-01]
MNIPLYSITQDPVYIGTGGFTIGRVDNTIVRDPITRIPKIPGTSVAGTWRYYTALNLYSYFRDEFKQDRQKRNEKTKDELYLENAPGWVKEYEGNQFAAIKCAGQDDQPNQSYEDVERDSTGHCGRCIVCKTFGFSKKNKSERGKVYFSDLHILFFPVYTIFGTRWITSKNLLEMAGVSINENTDERCVITFEQRENINLGWLNFQAKEINKETKNKLEDFLSENKFGINGLTEKIVIVSDHIISQIINSNLETRTSVSIDPLTGAAKKGALFTSEAIPRGTVFIGSVRIDKRPLSEQPSEEMVAQALKDSKKYFETLGIGGMVTRGFGRMKLFDFNDQNDGGESNGKS